jgi:hypothetical protein
MLLVDAKIYSALKMLKTVKNQLNLAESWVQVHTLGPMSELNLSAMVFVTQDKIHLFVPSVCTFSVIGNMSRGSE